MSRRRRGAATAAAPPVFDIVANITIIIECIILLLLLLLYRPRRLILSRYDKLFARSFYHPSEMITRDPLSRTYATPHSAKSIRVE